MRLLRAFPILAIAVVLLSIVGVSVATRSIGLLLVGGVLAALSWYVTEGPRGRSLPDWTANILIVAASLNVIVDLVQHTGDILAVLSRFVVLLTLIKLYQHKSPRDYAQLLGLSLLLMLVGSIQSNNLLFAVTLMLYTVLGLYVLLLFQLYAAHERNRSARLDAIPAGYHLAPSLQPIVGRRTAYHLRMLMIFIAVGGLAASSLLFVVFPRNIGEGLIATQSVGRRTGYTDEVNLASGTRITGSRRVVMNLRTTGASPRELLRLRGAVLDRYDGRGQWSRSALHHQHQHSLTTNPPRPKSLGPDVTGRGITQEFELLAPSRTIFSTAVPAAIGTRERHRFRFDRRTLTIIDAEGGRLYRYTVTALPEPTLADLQSLVGRTPDTSGALIVKQFDLFDSRVRRLAQDQLAQAKLDDRPPNDEHRRWAWNRAGAAVLTRFMQSGRFRYETDLRDVRLTGPDGSPRDPTVQFLFESRIGHCEYFASALAALCNTAGIPARLVTGYVALEYDERSGVYVVRESNAHAWVEVQTSPYRWETFDPTPSGTLHNIHSARDTQADQWRWIFDRLESKWSNHFVAYDDRAQRRLMTSFDGWSRWLDDALYAMREWMSQVNYAFYLGPAGYIWMGIVALAIVIAAIAVWTSLRRAARIRTTVKLQHVGGTAQRRMLRQLGFYLDMLTVLENAGRPKPRWQPPLDYADVLDREHPGGGSIARQLTRLFYAARYGRRNLSRDELAHAGTLVEELRTALAE